MAPDLYPTEASAEAEALVQAAVKAAVGAWGQRQLLELEAEDQLAFACEKAPTDDAVMTAVRPLPPPPVCPVASDRPTGRRSDLEQMHIERLSHLKSNEASSFQIACNPDSADRTAIYDPRIRGCLAVGLAEAMQVAAWRAPVQGVRADCGCTRGCARSCGRRSRSYSRSTRRSPMRRRLRL